VTNLVESHTLVPTHVRLSVLGKRSRLHPHLQQANTQLASVGVEGATLESEFPNNFLAPHTIRSTDTPLQTDPPPINAHVSAYSSITQYDGKANRSMTLRTNLYL